MNVVRSRPSADELEHLKVVKLVSVVNLSTERKKRQHATRQATQSETYQFRQYYRFGCCGSSIEGETSL